MSLVKEAEYIQPDKLTKFKNENNYDIRYKSTVSSLWFLTKKHRVGLLAFTAIVSLGYNFNLDNVIATLVF